MRFAVLAIGLAFAALSLATTLESALKELPQVRFPESRAVVSGAIDEAQVEALREAGIKHVVSLRPAEENPQFDEAKVAAAHGLKFHALPIKGPQSLTLDNAKAFDDIMNEVGHEPALLHCSSGNRVGALIALREGWIKGKSTEDAIDTGRRWGLAGLESAVRDALSSSGTSPPNR